jgi:hypothetical protein
MRLADLVDLLEAHAQRTLLVFDVDHSTMEPLTEVAREAGIAHAAYPANAVAVPRESLRALVDALPFHWDFGLVDMPAPPAADVVAKSPLNHPASVSADLGLPASAFPSAKLALHVHDDCYVRLHAADDVALRRVVARALSFYAGTLLGEGSADAGNLEECPPSLVDRLWSVPMSLTLLRTDAEAGPAGVAMGYSDVAYSFHERRAYPLAGRIRYVPSSRTWSLETV